MTLISTPPTRAACTRLRGRRHQHGVAAAQVLGGVARRAIAGVPATARGIAIAVFLLVDDDLYAFRDVARNRGGRT